MSKNLSKKFSNEHGKVGAVFFLSDPKGTIGYAPGVVGWAFSLLHEDLDIVYDFVWKAADDWGLSGHV